MQQSPLKALRKGQAAERRAEKHAVRRYTVWHHLLLLLRFTGLHFMVRLLYGKVPRVLARTVLPSGRTTKVLRTQPKHHRK